MALTPNEMAAYSKLWNFIQPAAITTSETGAYKYTSGDILSAASELYRNAGQALTVAESRGVFGLISIARKNQRSISNLNSASPTDYINASMIGEWPTAASLETQAAQPQYMVRGSFTYTDMTGTQQTQWITITGIDTMPPTASSIALAIEAAAISAYSPLKGTKSNYLPAEQLQEFGTVTQMQLYAV